MTYTQSVIVIALLAGMWIGLVACTYYLGRMYEMARDAALRPAEEEETFRA